MSPDDLVMDVIDSGFLARYWMKYLKPWMDPEEFKSELFLATVKASKRWDEKKGKWHTYCFWWWRSARSEMTRQWAKRNKHARSIPISHLTRKWYSKNRHAMRQLEYDPHDKRELSPEAVMLERAVDGLSSEERFFLLGASVKETEERGLTRSQYEVRRRQIRRKIRKEI